MSADRPVPPVLADALELGASGDSCVEAAVGLVTAHRVWLARALFFDCLVTCAEGGAMAWIEWDDVVDFLDERVASGSEKAMLLIAASLAGAQVTRSVGELVVRLDVANLALVLDAVAHANGFHHLGTTLTVTGVPGGA